MESYETEQNRNKADYLSIRIFKNENFGFSFQIRWSAQKPAIEQVMTGDAYANLDGTSELRAMTDHSIRIKAQAEVQRLVAKIFGRKTADFKNGNYRQFVEKLDQGQIQNIKAKMMDWQYSSAVYATDEEKAEKKALDALAILKGLGYTDEQLAALTQPK